MFHWKLFWTICQALFTSCFLLHHGWGITKSIFLMKCWFEKKLKMLVRTSSYSRWNESVNEPSGNAATGTQGTLKPLNQSIYFGILVGSWCLPWCLVGSWSHPDSLLWVSLLCTCLALNRNVLCLSPLSTWIAAPWIITFFCDPERKQTWVEMNLRGFKT